MSAQLGNWSIMNQRIVRRTVARATDDAKYRERRNLAPGTATHCYLCGYPLATDHECVNDECSASVT